MFLVFWKMGLFFLLKIEKKGGRKSPETSVWHFRAFHSPRADRRVRSGGWRGWVEADDGAGRVARAARTSGRATRGRGSRANRTRRRLRGSWGGREGSDARGAGAGDAGTRGGSASFARWFVTSGKRQHPRGRTVAVVRVVRPRRARRGLGPGGGHDRVVVRGRHVPLGRVRHRSEASGLARRVAHRRDVRDAIRRGGAGELSGRRERARRARRARRRARGRGRPAPVLVGGVDARRHLPRPAA